MKCKEVKGRDCFNPLSKVGGKAHLLKVKKTTITIKKKLMRMLKISMKISK